MDVNTCTVQHKALQLPDDINTIIDQGLIHRILFHLPSLDGLP